MVSFSRINRKNKKKKSTDKKTIVKFVCVSNFRLIKKKLTGINLYLLLLSKIKKNNWIKWKNWIQLKIKKNHIIYTNFIVLNTMKSMNIYSLSL